MTNEFKPISNVKDDTRFIMIRPKDGEKPTNAAGLIDHRLFSGKNCVVAEKDSSSIMWRLRYAMGVAPQEFDQNFTSFPKALDFTKAYFSKRNCEVYEVRD